MMEAFFVPRFVAGPPVSYRQFPLISANFCSDRPDL